MHSPTASGSPPSTRKPFTLLTRTRDRDHSRSEDETMTRGSARQWGASRARATASRWALVSLLTLLILYSVMARADAQQATPQATPVATRRAPVWTQVGPEGALVARTLVHDACPPITLDGSSQPMPPRVGPNGADFPETVCEAPIPVGTGSAAIDGQPLALLPAHLARIAVIGDTGCRIDKDWAQDCSVPDHRGAGCGVAAGPHRSCRRLLLSGSGVSDRDRAGLRRFTVGRQSGLL